MIKEMLSVLFLSILPVVRLSAYSDDFTIDNHVLMSVNDKDAEEIRIYKEKEVTVIDEHAFDGCHFTSIMISTTVIMVNANFTDGITINYTGALEDIAFSYPNTVTVYEYACDEGFLNYWTSYIRLDPNGSICDVKKNDYLKMKELYRSLSEEDVEVVDAIKDGSGTIKNSIKYLDSLFGNVSPSPVKEKEVSQSVMITLILIIASFGMTSIGIFYFLKDRKMIK